MMYRRAGRRLRVLIAAFALIAATTALAEIQSGTYGGTLRVVRFDVSPPLRDIPPIPVQRAPADWGGAIVDPPGTEGKPEYGPQSRDEVVQHQAPSAEMPAPIISFDAISNQGVVLPPDPVGDIGTDHYVTMSNFHFVIHNRNGALAYGPAANNTLWSGFGGPCQSQNAGDPVVLYDQFVDRWIMTQFTSSPESGTGDYYNCLAVSMTGDPTGTWRRYQINNGDNFPDYPKYGVGEDAYFLSTRDFATGYAGVGVYALNKQDFINGTVGGDSVIYFFVPRNVSPQNIGDGLLPMDIDGSTPPPVGSPHYYVGTMDDGGPYGAPQDAVIIWEFTPDFLTPGNSTFVLTAVVPISPYDTVYPCTGLSGRSCIPQPDTAVRLDHQGYRQRPLHRAAYRNYGTHESIVTLQSVEAVETIAGMRWWEIRNPGDSPAIHQEGTFAPGVEDGIHRWFGSVAMDAAGNIALGYSASSASTFPTIRYSGRLFTDAPGILPQGEGEIVQGAGSQTHTGSRWGDYSSMNVDPVDDCTFWYVNEYYAATSTSDWRLRVGAFSFDECGEPGFALSMVSDPVASICAGEETGFDFNLGSVDGFDMPVTLQAMGHPAGTTAGFSANPVLLPGASTLTVSDTGTALAGGYDITVTGSATGADNRSVEAALTVFDAVPAAPTLLVPANSATAVPPNPTFEWSDTGAEAYVIEVASDPGFADVVWSEVIEQVEANPPSPLDYGTTYYWRVRGENACGAGDRSTVYSFTTMALPGQCADNQVETVVHHFDFENGPQGWTSNSTVGPDTWTLSGANPASGVQHWHGDDVAERSDQRLVSPVLTFPSGWVSLTFGFLNSQHFENDTISPPNCWDAGILEVSTDGGNTFTQVPNERLLTDPYDGIINAGGIDPNPLEGRMGWCGAPQPYIDSLVDISHLAGQSNVVFRFRIGTDGGTDAPGWDIDDIKVIGCSTILEFDHGFEDGGGQ